MTQELVHKIWLTCLRPLAEPVTAWHKTHELPARICWHFIWQPFWKTSFSNPPNRLKPTQPQICELESMDHTSCGNTLGCPLNASSLSLSTSFIPCTLLGKTGKHSLGNALTTGWILFPHKSESLGLSLWTCQTPKYFANLPADTQWLQQSWSVSLILQLSFTVAKEFPSTYLPRNSWSR